MKQTASGGLESILAALANGGKPVGQMAQQPGAMSPAAISSQPAQPNQLQGLNPTMPAISQPGLEGLSPEILAMLQSMGLLPTQTPGIPA